MTLLIMGIGVGVIAGIVKGNHFKWTMIQDGKSDAIRNIIEDFFVLFFMFMLLLGITNKFPLLFIGLCLICLGTGLITYLYLFPFTGKIEQNTKQSVIEFWRKIKQYAYGRQVR